MQEQPNKDNFLYEISLMMHGFGDSPTPNTETVQLMENIVRRQLREMLCDITVRNSNRTFTIITSEDIIFYLRKSKQQVQRLFKYIKYKYQTSKPATNFKSGFVKETNLLLKNVKSFLENLDETGELLDTNIFDAVKHSRCLRAERISNTLDEQKYVEYAKARCASFHISRFSKLQNERFNKWIDPQHDFNLRSGAVELLSFLAYGIVANVTDMALIIRENNSYMANDPLQMKIGHYHNSMMFNVPHITWNNSLHVNKGQPPITTNELYEVCRRCYMPQVGYMRFSNKSILGKRKLCY